MIYKENLMLLDHIKFFIKFGFIVISPIIGLYAFSLFVKIGWVKISIIFLIYCIIIAMMIFKPKTQLTEEEKRHNERMEKLRQELSRPVIQARLTKKNNK